MKIKKVQTQQQNEKISKENQTIVGKEKVVKKSRQKKRSEIDILIENFVLVQKALTETAIAFKSLQNRFDKFLQLVEKAALSEAVPQAKKQEKMFGEKELTKGVERSDLVGKIDALIEQNKAIAEGMMLLERIIKEKLEKE